MTINLAAFSNSLTLTSLFAFFMNLAPAMSQENKVDCMDATQILYAKQKEVEPPLGVYDKAIVVESDGGIYREERLCSSETELPVTSLYYVFGKLHGEFRSSNYWSGRDLELYDDEGRLRIVKTNVTYDFKRVLYFDAEGKLKGQTKVRNFGTAEILDLYTRGELPDAVLLLWLLHYHGEADGADNGYIFFAWLMSNRDKALKLMKKLDRDLSQALGQFAVGGISDRILVDGTTQQSRFRAQFKVGDSQTTDNIILNLKNREEIKAGDKASKP